MKWVKTGINTYKYVSDDDPRTPVTLKPKEIGIPYVKFIPSWRKYEPHFLNNDPERKENFKRNDAFIYEREHETRTDPKARRWESSRKEEWVKNKPAWRKQMIREGLIT